MSDFAACGRPRIEAQLWASLPGSRPIHRWILRNTQGMEVAISDLGASLLSWSAPDARGVFDNVLLGHGHAQAYRRGRCFMGGVVGRWANRIRAGRFELDGVAYQLDRNDLPHHLHGGNPGFHHALWDGQIDGDGLLLRLQSADGANGYPGQLNVSLRYALYDDGVLTLDYHASSDRPTPINLSAHPYFNLGGVPGGIGDHVVCIDADSYLAVDGGLIPIRREPVAGTAFDFRRPAALGDRLDVADAQLTLAGGFDHCYCLKGEPGLMRDVARISHPASGRRLSVRTDQRGLQLYTGQHLAGADDGHGGKFQAFAGFCVEAQAFPDQINSDEAEQCVLRPGAMYRQHTSYRMGLMTDQA